MKPASTEPVTARSADLATEGRVAGIVQALSGGTLSAEEVFAAFEELDALPRESVRAALAAWTGPAPDPEQLDALTRAAHGFAPPRLHLVLRGLTRDADVLFLGDVAEEQLRQVGIAWDGLDRAPEERLDGEHADAFTRVVHRVYADARAPEGAPLYDVLVHDDTSGLVFRAGTAQVLGAIADGVVEMNDRVARAAIGEALTQDESSFEPPAVDEPGDDDAAAPDDDAFASADEISAQIEMFAEAAPPTPPATKKATATRKVTATKKAAATKKATPSPIEAADDVAPKKTAAKKKSAKTDDDAPKKTAAKKKSARADSDAPKKAAAKKKSAKADSDAPKKTAAKKKSAKTDSDGPKKTAPKKKSANAAPKKTAAKKKSSSEE